MKERLFTLVKVFYHMVIIIAIGVSSMGLLIHTFLNVVMYDVDINWIHVIASVITLIFIISNSFNFKITGIK